jgi:hypothetical protein
MKVGCLHFCVTRLECDVGDRSIAVARETKGGQRLEQRSLALEDADVRSVALKLTRSSVSAAITSRRAEAAANP